MRPLTASCPKPMLPVGDRPLVGHVLDTAVAAGASRFVVVVGYAAERVRSVVGNSWDGVPVAFAEQPEQRGTAHAVQQAIPHLEEDPFAVINGDALYDQAGLRELYGVAAGVGATRVADPRPYGVLVLNGDRVTGVIEKPAEPPSDLVNTGAYVFPAAAQEWLNVEVSARGEYELTDVLARACREVKVRPVAIDRWLDVGRPWELLEANEWKLGELTGAIHGEVHESVVTEGTVVVAEDAVVRQGVTIEGPVYVGPGAHVGPNTFVRGATMLGEGVRVGHGVEVKNSVVMAGSAVPHLSYVGDSVLGQEVNLGAGTIVANLRHDDEPVRLTVKGDRVSTGRRKFGVVVGDGVKTGIGTRLNAGVTLSAGAWTKPGEVVTRDR